MAAIWVMAAGPAAFAAPSGGAAGGALAVAGWLGLDDLGGSLLRLLSVQLPIGFVLGIVAGEAGRVAWKAGLGAFKALATFGGAAARYGVVAVMLAAVLYFV